MIFPRVRKNRTQKLQHMVPRRPKGAPGAPQESSGAAQEAPGTPQESPKSRQERPRGSPRGPRGGPREAQERPWSGPGAPRARRRPKMAPRRDQKWLSMEAPGASKRTDETTRETISRKGDTTLHVSANGQKVFRNREARDHLTQCQLASRAFNARVHSSIYIY